MALLFFGVIACLAYVHLDGERDDLARGYKSLHNPLKGQQLAANVLRYGHRAGFPLLVIATVAVVLGFALLNAGLYECGGHDWYRVTVTSRAQMLAADEPLPPPKYLDFLAYTLISFIRVVDLLDIANTYNHAHISYVQQVRWPASTLLALFRAFFTMVLLQQLAATVRHGNLLAQQISDYWSPHPPIRERAGTALTQFGPAVVRPLLCSLRAGLPDAGAAGRSAAAARGTWSGRGPGPCPPPAAPKRERARRGGWSAGPLAIARCPEAAGVPRGRSQRPRAPGFGRRAGGDFRTRPAAPGQDLVAAASIGGRPALVWLGAALAFLVGAVSSN